MAESREPPAIEPSEIVGDRFRVGPIIGRGGMSVVYEATHIQLGQHVAVKVLGTLQSARRGAFERALIEAQATARMTSEHVVRVFDVGTTKAGHAYVVMEKLVGNDLAQEIRKGIPSPVGDAVKIVLQVCHALAEAHAAGIVHRDVKPSNLFLAMQPDKTVVVKVLDFGLARADSSVAKASGASTMPRMAGSPGYASPEQLGTASDVDARADVWGLGIVLYELITGRRPFEAVNLTDGLIAASTLPMPPMKSVHGPVPPAFEAIVRRCLEKDRENRFGSIMDLADAIHPYAPPAYARYSERVRAVGGRGLHSAGTIRVTLPDGLASGGATTFSDTGSQSSKMEPNTEMGVANPAALVVASVVPPHRTALRLVLAAAVVGILLFVVLSGRRLPTAPPPPSGAALGAPATPSSLGPLPPLVVSTAPAAPPEIATVVPSVAGTIAVVAATPVVGSKTETAPPSGRPALVRVTPRPPAPPKTTAAVGSGKGPADNPMTYR